MDGLRHSRDDLIRLAARVATVLTERGAERNDRVATMLDNGRAMLGAWLGAPWAGMSVLPVNSRLRGLTLAHQLRHGEPRVVIAADHLAHAVTNIAPDLRVLAESDFLATVDAADDSPLARPPDIGCILYTSGTTGRPKGVMWSPETQARHARAYAQELVRLEAGESAYSCLPLYHVTCMGVTMAALQHGATVHLDTRFSVSAFWSRIVETSAVFFPYVGSMLSLLNKAPPDPNGRRHKVRYAMGAAASETVWTAFVERFNVPLLETYGQTELGAIWIANSGDAPVGSIGRICPRAELELRQSPFRGPNEMWVRPKTRQDMMAGYFRDPVATAACFDAKGWYATNDLATTSSDGSLRYRGRLADSIRRRGENVSAFEVEIALSAHPDVVEAAVIGVPSELGEEDVAAYYVRREGSCATAPEIRDWCSAHLSDFMVPRYFRRVDTFPRTATERVQKWRLPEASRLLESWDSMGAEQMKESAPTAEVDR